ncbi:MAG: hypothetical protein K9N10_08790 [Deltaproteobacteria bacterium]|nr:hypothetical protein [Deltaproteobacteria bacterium]
MPSPITIEYPGAWYHVMDRVRRFENVFEDGQDYRVFVDILKDASKIWHVKIDGSVKSRHPVEKRGPVLF